VGPDKTRSHPQLRYKPSNNMRNTRQGATTLEEGDNVTMQQLMETIHTLQQTVVASKDDQDKILAKVQAEQTASQNRFQVDLDA